MPLPGVPQDHGLPCDSCLTLRRPWCEGRAAFVYEDIGRSLVLALKHGDRTDLAVPAARWMARAGADLLGDRPLIAPVPLHWRRLFRRRYNQAALLAQRLARLTGQEVCVDLLQRIRRTPALELASVETRFAALAGAMRLHPRRAARLRGRAVVLVDDVMTSGATLDACAGACLDGGAREVRILTLARPLLRA